MTTSLIVIFLLSSFGVRRQSEAATALWTHVPNSGRIQRASNSARIQSGVGLRLPPHSKIDQAPDIQSAFDPITNTTTVRMAPVRISGEKDKYHSLHLGASFSYSGQTPRRPETLDFELRSIVKARKLKVDLYVVFLVDGETVFLSSNRSAIKNPVPGRRWVGERLVFRMPYQTLLKITEAKKFTIKMDAVRFEVGEEQLEALRTFAEKL